MYQRKLNKMDHEKMLRHVSNLNDYISVTQEVTKHPNSFSKVQFNMSTVLLLKKVRSLEIEYFNKCGGNGAVLVLFERMVEQPPSKTWGLLGKELVALLQYWLDAIRKHVISHNHHWWTFLKLLLKFIKRIRTKDHSLPDILVEGTAECLLDLATSSQPDVLQRHEILWCLNVCSADSSRTIRLTLRNKFEAYFAKLATFLSTCGYLPSQYSALEALMRWLLPRRDAGLRASAAEGWFPEAVCGRKALDVFLERRWQDFYQDARDFLNACNDFSELVTSVVCRKVTVGTVVVVSGTEKKATWLDVNSSNNSLSIVLDLPLLDSLRVKEVTAWETLAVSEEDVINAELYRESSEATFIVTTTHGLRLSPSGTDLSGSMLKIVLSSSCDLKRVDVALRGVFSHKYQVLMDLEQSTTLSPQEYRNNAKRLQNSLEEDTRFSHPVEVQRRKRSGFIVRTRKPVSWRSPSTASTTSLAQLHEKLAALPQYDFNKVAVNVCAQPSLSTVTEISETDDRHNVISQTIKTNRPVGVYQRNLKVDDRNSQSDGEVKPRVDRYLSPIENEEHSTNCLLIATIGSADESVINDTLERLTKHKDYRPDNIVDLLVQEALHKDMNDKEFMDSGINSGDVTKKTEIVSERSAAVEKQVTDSKAIEGTVDETNKKVTNANEYNKAVNLNVIEINSEAIENTPFEKPVAIDKEKQKICTVISNTTTDESNDIICEMPKYFVNVRKRNAKTKLAKRREIPEVINEGFDENAVEDFFSQHISENNRGEVLISPTLARKINESSSESELFDECLMIPEGNLNIDYNVLQDLEVVECLNSILDIVCIDFEKLAELTNLNRDIEVIDDANKMASNPTDIVPLTDIINIENREIQKHKSDGKPKKGLKLKYTAKMTAKSTRTRAKKRNNKLELEKATEISPIRETRDTNVQNEDKAFDTKNVGQSPRNNTPSNKSTDSDTPVQRRKRKLYSPKFEDIDSQQMITVDDDNNFKASKMQTPQFNSTCYKDIEIERKKRIRQPRSRKSKAKFDTPSPRTKKKNDLFDQLKETIESSVKVVVADKKTEKDMAVYNFTNDSEDEDFKKKKIEVQKRISSTTIASCHSAMSTRHGRTVNRINYSENKSSDEIVKKISTKQKKTVKRKRTPKMRLAKPVSVLVDEKMRKAAAVELNTSLIAEKHKEFVPEEPKFVLTVNPEMEMIPDEQIIEVVDETEKQKNPKKKQKKAEVLSLKKNKTVNSSTLDQDNDDRTISPLPGLVIEVMPVKTDDANDSVSTNMLQKLMKLNENGSDIFIYETNTTQNLLSDVERINYSPIQINVNEEFLKLDNSKTENKNSRTFKSNTKKKLKNTKPTEILSVKKEFAGNIKRNLRSSKTLEVVKLSDTNSEKSIATIGKSPITAHGDSNEPPPDSELLTQKVTPRDLEIEYLNQSIKEYYNILREEINVIKDARNDSNGSDSTKIIPSYGLKNIPISPVVSVQRLSFDDISKWLPSPRNSDTDSSYVESINRNATKMSTPKITRKPRKESSDQEINRSVQEIDLTPESNSVSRTKKTMITKSVHSKYNKPKEHTDYERSYDHVPSKGLRSRTSKNDLEKFSNKNDVFKNTFTKITPPTIETKVKNKKTKKTKEEQENRLSMISPIIGFDETSPTVEQKSPILRPNSSHKQEFNTDNKTSYDHVPSKGLRSRTSKNNLEDISNRKNDDFNTFTKTTPPTIETKVSKVKNKKTKKSKEKQEHRVSMISPINCFDKTSPVEQKSPILRPNPPRKQESTIDRQQSSIASKSNLDTEITKYDSDVQRRKRQSSPEIGHPKRRKFECSVDTIKSGPSVASVNEWFRRNETQAISAAERIEGSMRDYVVNVLEKVETSLVEMQQDTAKMVMAMSVDEQKRLTELRDQLSRALLQARDELVDTFVTAVNEKFADINARSQEMYVALSEQLKSRARVTIREDCRKKQLMISLLRDDLNTMLKRYNGDTP